MRYPKLTYAAAFAAAAAALLACTADTGGDGTPLSGIRIWIADQPDKKVVIYDTDGNLLKTVGGFGIFSKPNSLDVYKANGAVWICDFYTNQIRKFDADGNLLYSTSGPGQEFLVRNPVSLSVAQTSGECWVSDRGNNRLLRLGANGGEVARVTGFLYPRGVSADPASGDVWVADEGNDAVVKISGAASGQVKVGAVELARYTGLNNPWAVAADANGNGWVTSRIEGRLVKLSASGAELASVGGFGAPAAVAVDETAGAVYVVDTDKGILVSLPRNVNGTYDNFNGVADFVVSGLTHPEDLYVDEKNGHLFVAEMGSGKIRMYDGEGKLTNTLGGFSGPAAVTAWDGG